MPSVAVIGGGITGLVAAYEMRGRADVVVLEASNRYGGKIRTSKIDGLTLEDGPDSFLPRDDVPLSLCRSLGLGDQLVEPADFGAWLWRDDRLVALPQGFVFGLPSSPLSILKTGLLSPGGIVRAAADLVLPGPLTGPDVSVAAVIERRFGREVLERLVDPLLAGTRAGDARTMSLAAAIPQIDLVARSHRSITFGLRAQRKRAGGDTRPRFYSLRGGMQVLTDALVDALDADLRTSAAVTNIRTHGDAFVVGTDTEQITVDAVVIAVPAHVAARLLSDLAPAAATALGRIKYASVATANFTYPDGAVRTPSSGSGVLVPGSENRTIAACTWVSSKWPHTAPPGTTILRAFAGRSEQDAVLALSDDELLDRMEGDLADILGITTAPDIRRLTRWEQGIPQFEVGHLEAMDLIERGLAEWPRVALAGAGYRGTGIPDCIAQGRTAAKKVLATSLVGAGPD
jgi:oxygen-dependent protoporphyrinogen oxidase